MRDVSRNVKPKPGQFGVHQGRVKTSQGLTTGESGRSVFSVAGPLVLPGEEAVQFRGYPIGLLAVVRGGVPGAVQHYSSRVWQDPAEPVE